LLGACSHTCLPPFNNPRPPTGKSDAPDTEPLKLITAGGFAGAGHDVLPLVGGDELKSQNYPQTNVEVSRMDSRHQSAPPQVNSAGIVECVHQGSASVLSRGRSPCRTAASYTVGPKTIQHGANDIPERPVMPISDLINLRKAYVTANKALATCRKAQLAPDPRVYEKAYAANRQALNAYNVEAELVATANYPRPNN
jgi:hypothetical protein